MKEIFERRSIRQFKNTKVTDEDIEKIINAMMAAPSAKNRQNWKVMVLKDEEKNHVADIMIHALEDESFELPGYANSSRYSAEVMKQADVVMLVLKEIDELWEYEDLISIGAAIENICLMAQSLNLGSLWIRDTIYTQKRILEYIGHPELDLVSAIAIGDSNEHPQMRPRKRKEEVVL